MKRFTLCLLLPLLAYGQTTDKPKKSASSLPEGFHELKIGDAAPDFELVGVDEEMHTLKEYAKAPSPVCS